MWDRIKSDPAKQPEPDTVSQPIQNQNLIKQERKDRG